MIPRFVALAPARMTGPLSDSRRVCREISVAKQTSLGSHRSRILSKQFLSKTQTSVHCQGKLLSSGYLQATEKTIQRANKTPAAATQGLKQAGREKRRLQAEHKSLLEGGTPSPLSLPRLKGPRSRPPCAISSHFCDSATKEAPSNVYPAPWGRTSMNKEVGTKRTKLLKQPQVPQNLTVFPLCPNGSCADGVSLTLPSACASEVTNDPVNA